MGFHSPWRHRFLRGGATIGFVYSSSCDWDERLALKNHDPSRQRRWRPMGFVVFPSSPRREHPSIATSHTQRAHPNKNTKMKSSGLKHDGTPDGSIRPNADRATKRRALDPALASGNSPNHACVLYNSRHLSCSSFLAKMIFQNLRHHFHLFATLAQETTSKPDSRPPPDSTHLVRMACAHGYQTYCRRGQHGTYYSSAQGCNKIHDEKRVQTWPPKYS